MTPFKVNLDYEASLFDPHYREDSSANLKIIREFEYVYFLVQKEKSALKNFKGYEQKYLDGLKEMGFIIPTFDPKAAQFQNWWGKNQNFELEQKLNSKLTSALIAQNNHWGFWEGALIENLDQLKFHVTKNPQYTRWIIKRPHGFSGIGHYLFDSQNLEGQSTEALSKILTEKVLLEPIYDRLFDIGTTFVINDGIIEKYFMIENLNSSSGRFTGGIGAKNVDKFKKYILIKYGFDLDELDVIAGKIAQHYLSIGATSNVQIDSFVYKEEGKLKLYPLVEVNYRKTMGLVIQSLAEFFEDSDLVEWKIEPAKNEVKEEEWTRLSPLGNHFHSYVKKIKFS
jgi:hypothetical protein